MVCEYNHSVPWPTVYIQVSRYYPLKHGTGPAFLSERDRIETEEERKTENERGVEEASQPVTAHQFLGHYIDRLRRLDIREVIHFLDRRHRGARAAPFVT